MNKKNFITFSLLVIIFFLTISCSILGNNNKIDEIINLGLSGGNSNQEGKAYYINYDQNSVMQFISGFLFDGSNYYISGSASNFLGLIKLDSDLQVVYAKKYIGDQSIYSYVFTNLSFNPFNSSKLYVGGMINNTGIIAEIDKNTGDLNIIKSYNNAGSISILNDLNNLYGIVQTGYILKFDYNLNLLTAKYAATYGEYIFSNPIQNNNFIAIHYAKRNIFNIYYDYGIILINKDLTSAYEISGVDPLTRSTINDNNLYLIDTKLVDPMGQNNNRNLILAKIDLSNPNNFNVTSSKEYIVNDRFISIRSALINQDLIIGFSNLNGTLTFLKINTQNLDIVSQINLTPRNNDRLSIDHILPLNNGGFCAISYFNNFGYILQMPSNFNLNLNNCVFNISSSNITATNFNYNLNLSDITNNFNDQSLTEANTPNLNSQDLNVVLNCSNP